MDPDLYRAAIDGNIDILNRENVSSDYYLQQTKSQNNNIIHVAAVTTRQRSASFIKEAMRKFGSKHLATQQNVDGNTPLHVAALKGNKDAVEAILHVLDSASRSQLWSTQNKDGNTPLHLALHKPRDAAWVNYILATPFLPTLPILNTNGDSLLHLYVRYYCVDIHKHDMLPEAIGVHIRALSRANTSAACIKDKDGLTPLLRAAKSCCLVAVQTIIEESPESLEICDSDGRTVLHHITQPVYQQFKDLVDISVVNVLKNAEDNMGNTPAHLAVEKSDFVVVKVLLECFADFHIKNMKKVTPLDLIQSKTNFLGTMTEMEITNMRHMTKEQFMDDKLVEAVKKGDVTILNDTTSEDDNGINFLSRMGNGWNIMHLAIKYDQREWVEKAVSQFPQLIYQVDPNGENPLHIAAKFHNSAAQLLIDSFPDCYRKVNNYIPIHPLKVKNSKGNPPLHEALCACNYKIALPMINAAPETASIINENGETALHLLAKHKPIIRGNVEVIHLRDEIERAWDESKRVERELMEKSEWTAYMRDKDGLTPFLRAALFNNYAFFDKDILREYPQVTQQRDSNGRTILHLIKYVLYGMSYSEEQIDALRAVQDDDGNTPLHVALKSAHFDLAYVLMKRCVEASDRRELYLHNQLGQTIPTLLAQPDVPNYVIKQYKKLHPMFKPNTEKSSLGITTKQMKEAATAMSVIASLLATITFAAAFTVPGGVNQDTGIPIFVKKAAFQMFMIFDTFAMFSSMVVLFMIVWIMIGNKEVSLILIDICVSLLEASLLATILAFATGIYITTHRQIKWLPILVFIISAIFSLVLLVYKEVLPRIFSFFYYKYRRFVAKFIMVA